MEQSYGIICHEIFRSIYHMYATTNYQQIIYKVIRFHTESHKYLDYI